jgi:hypothetical protein
MPERNTRQKEIIAQFLSSAERFTEAVRGLPEAALDCSTGPGEWGIRQIVHHVADDADAWCFGFKKALANPGAPLRFEGFPGNERWFAALAFDRRPVHAGLALIEAHRQLMAELAEWAPLDWEDSFLEVFDDQGNSMGKWSAGQILEMLTGHTLEHLQTIQTIRQRHQI